MGSVAHHRICKYMNDWTLQIIIEHFDEVVKGIDFGQLPDWKSEEYRQLVLQTANDQIFSKGRYSEITEWVLEIFDEKEVRELVNDDTELSQLSEEEQRRLSFYLDVEKVCYPLFRGEKIDWSAWPWLLEDGSSSLDNKPLYELITNEKRPYLGAAMLYALKQRMWQGDDGFFSSVALQDASVAFDRSVARHWKGDLSAEELKLLVMEVWKCAADLLIIENHIQIGRLMGLDPLAQSLYDAMDTYISENYYAKQVLCAKELAAWIREHLTIGERHPAPEKTEALRTKMDELMDKYHVVSPDRDFTWDIITLDVMGYGMENS